MVASSSKVPRGHPVATFMYTYIEAIKKDEKELGAVNLTQENHPEVWEDERMRKMVINIFCSMGTNAFLKGDMFHAMDLATVVILLEKYDGEDYFTALTGNLSVNEDNLSISGGEEIDVICFFKKRIPCSCLNEKYSHFNQFQKRGSKCEKCREKKNCKTLMTCNGCRSVHYCSRDCQVLDWPDHRERWKKMNSSLKIVNSMVKEGREITITTTENEK